MLPEIKLKDAVVSLRDYDELTTEQRTREPQDVRYIRNTEFYGEFTIRMLAECLLKHYEYFKFKAR